MTPLFFLSLSSPPLFTALFSPTSAQRSIATFVLLLNSGNCLFIGTCIGCTAVVHHHHVNVFVPFCTLPGIRATAARCNRLSHQLTNYCALQFRRSATCRCVNSHHTIQQQPKKKSHRVECSGDRILHQQTKSSASFNSLFFSSNLLWR